jgi:hypothetical protein
VNHDPRQQGFLVACCLLVATLWSPALGQPGSAPSDPARVAAVKAGMVINFVRYTTWPESSFDEADEIAPIVITIVGESSIERALAAAAKDQLVGGRSLEIRRLLHPRADGDEPTASEEEVAAFYTELRESHVVYFETSEEHRYGEALEALDGSAVLTLSDISGFAEGGGMLGLAIRDRRVTFDANEEAIKECALRVSSQVLQLARIVRRSEGERAGKPSERDGP